MGRNPTRLGSSPAPFHLSTLCFCQEKPHWERQQKIALSIVLKSAALLGNVNKQTVKGKKIPSSGLEAEMKRRQKGETLFYLTFQILLIN